MWHNWLYVLSNGDYTKWGHFYEMNCIELLNLMSYHVARTNNK